MHPHRILEISHNTISSDSRSHREIFALFSYSWHTVVAGMIRGTINKELPDGNRETNGWYYPEAFRHSTIFLFLRDFWSVQQSTRNICVTCIFHGANGFPVTIVNISGSILCKTTGNIEDFLRTRRGSRRVDEKDRGEVREETGSLLQPLACRYYTTGWISLGSDITLFATNCRCRFSINRAMKPMRDCFHQPSITNVVHPGMIFPIILYHECVTRNIEISENEKCFESKILMQIFLSHLKLSKFYLICVIPLVRSVLIIHPLIDCIVIVIIWEAELIQNLIYLIN